MPVFSLRTNLPSSLVGQRFFQLTTTLLAELMGKPAAAVFVHVQSGQQMTRGGDDSPCAFATLYSIGKLDASSNLRYSSTICEHLKQELGIPPDRCSIFYQHFDASFVGTNCSTKAELDKAQ